MQLILRIFRKIGSSTELLDGPVVALLDGLVVALLGVPVVALLAGEEFGANCLTLEKNEVMDSWSLPSPGLFLAMVSRNLAVLRISFLWWCAVVYCCVRVFGFEGAGVFFGGVS